MVCFHCVSRRVLRGERLGLDDDRRALGDGLLDLRLRLGALLLGQFFDGAAESVEARGERCEVADGVGRR